MNPFDAPPSTPAVSYEPPRPPKRRRGRVIGAAVLGAGLVGVGAVGAAALDAEDDRESDRSSASSTSSSATSEPLVAQDDDALVRTAAQDDQLDQGDLRELHECLGLPENWADAPFVGEGFDLDQLPPLEELLGEDFSLDELFGEFEGELPMFEEWTTEGELPALEELLGEDFSLDELFGEFEGELPMFEEWTTEGALPALEELFGDDFTLDDLFGEFEGEFPMFEDFTVEGASAPAVVGDADIDEMLGAVLDEIEGLVVLMGPDGPIVVDLGDGDGAVTIERNGETGEVTITTDGDAVEVGPDELFDEMIVPLIPGDVQDCFDGFGADET